MNVIFLAQNSWQPDGVSPLRGSTRLGAGSSFQRFDWDKHSGSRLTGFGSGKNPTARNRRPSAASSSESNPLGLAKLFGGPPWRFYRTNLDGRDPIGRRVRSHVNVKGANFPFWIVTEEQKNG